jgi:hypothetical protein
VIADPKHTSLREIDDQIAEVALDQDSMWETRCMATRSHRMRMLQHLGRQQLIDQLVRSVEHCEYERCAREGVERAARSSKFVKVIAQKTEDDRGKS